MRIGIDARLIEETGVGRYIKNLLAELEKIDSKNEYIIYLPPQACDVFILPNQRWQKRAVAIHWHSVAEQLLLPVMYLKDHLDLLHVPYFTVPILYPGKIITTVHDLTILHERTGKATTLPLPLYYLKHLAYRWILAAGIRRACHIITVSQTIAREIADTYHLTNEKISFFYEGVDTDLLGEADSLKVSEPFLLYVGNAYPHKNLDILLQSLAKLTAPLKLVLVGNDDFFYHRLMTQIHSMQLSDRVVLLTHIHDKELSALYSHAVATVFPSKMEGFGLPAIEALAHDCPMIVSDIPVFREILDGTSVVFVSPTDVAAWVSAIESVVRQKKSLIWKTKAEKQNFFERFSWKHLAAETLKVYESCNRL